MPAFSDHFSGVSRAYAAFRPRYPDALFDWLATLPARRELAWDCATGSGQAAVALADRFAHVVATDASASQLAAATPHARVTYAVATAEASGLADATVDLVTVAQALHWFDRDAFWREVHRVLAPGGAIAVWTYGRHHVDDPAIDAVVQRFMEETVGPWWPPERALVDAAYRTIEFPFVELEPPAFALHAEWRLEEMLGYMSTWSATVRYREARGDDPIPALRDALGARWGGDDAVRRVTWPLAVRAGHPGG